MILPPTRRAALGLLASAAAGAALPLARTGPASAQLAPSPFGAPKALPPGLRFGAMAVDADRVARLGNPGGAALVVRHLTRQLRAVFADLLVAPGAGGATLTARISSLYLASYAGTQSYGHRSEGPNNDDLEGAGVLSSGGRVLAEVPLLAVLDAGYSGAWYLPDIDERRIASISHQFAYWLRREMGV